MPQERAVLEVVADVNKALAEFQRFERQWKQAVARLDAAADDVEFDRAGASLDKLRRDARAAFTGMQRSARAAGRQVKELAGHSRTSAGAQRELNGEVRNLERRLKTAEKALGRFEKSGARSTRQVRRGVRGLSSDVRRLSALFGGLSVAFAGRAIFQQLNTFSLRMAGVQAVTKATREEMRALTAQAIELGEETQKSTSQVAAAQENLGRAGFTTNEILAATPGLLNLAIAGQLEMAEATTIAADTLRGFNLVAEETGRVADVVAQTAASTNTTVRELGEGIKFVAPVAASLKIPLEDAAAAMGVLADRGFKGTLGGTALRRILAALAQGTPKTEKALARLGLTLDQVNPSTVELAEIFGLLQQKGLGAVEAFEIAGQRGGPALLALAAAAPRVGELTDELEAAGGAARDMAEVFEGSLFGASKRLTSAFDGLVQKTGDRGLSKILRNVLDLLAAVIRRGDQLGDILIGLVAGSLTPLVLGLEATTRGLGAVVLAISRVQRAAGLDVAADKTAALAREVAFAGDVVTEFRQNLVRDVRQAGESFAELFEGAADDVGKLEAAIDDQVESLDKFRSELEAAGTVSTEQAREIVKRAASIVAAINKLPPAQRQAREELAASLAAIREEYRETGAVVGDVTEDQIAELAKLAEATEKVLEDVSGSGLKLQVTAIREAVDELRAAGELTAETQARIAVKVAAVSKEFARLKLPPTAELETLRKEFGLTGDALDKLGDDAAGAAPKVATLDQSFRGLAGGLDALRAAQDAVADQARATENLAERLEELQGKAVLTSEELAELGRIERELFLASTDLATKRQELAQAETEVANGAAGTAQSIQAMLDPLRSSGQLSEAAALKLLEQRDAQADQTRELYEGQTAFELVNEALKSYIAAAEPARDVTAANAVVLEKAADGSHVLRTETEGAAISIKKTADGLFVFNKAAADARFGELAVEVGRSAEGMLTLSNVAPRAADGVEKIGAAGEDAAAGLEAIAEAAPAAGDGARDLAEGLEDAAAPMRETADDAGELAGSLEDVATRSRQAAGSIADDWRSVRGVLRDVTRELDEIGERIERIAAAAGSGGGAPTDPPPEP